MDRRDVLRDAAGVAAGFALLRMATGCASEAMRPGADGGGAAGPDAGGGGSAPDAGPAPAECEPVVTTFPTIVDPHATTSFTRMDESNFFDWLTIGASASTLMRDHVPAAVLNLLRALDDLWIGYPMSLLAHSLQTATRAARAGASDDLVLAALCHDIGCAIAVDGHAEISAAVLRTYVSEGAYRVVRHHTEFEWQHYGQLIGQPTNQRAAYAGQSWFGDAERFADEWEMPSFDPGYASDPLEAFEPLVRDRFGNGSLASSLTSGDCLPGGPR
jgi:predicted HD phosphohydrolase